MTVGDDVAWLSVDALQELLTTRAISSVELVRCLFSRIELFEPRLHAFITVAGDEALEAAAKADAEAVQGGARGAFHGIPVGVKDAIDVEGMRCTFGSRILSDRTARTDADVVRALRGSGALVIGKQNLHEFAYGITSENEHFGDVANPWDPRRIAGGSTGGTAAAIAAGLCPAGIGTDTGGSIRIPAAMCGVVGLKPTSGLVSRRGVLPLAWSLDHVGPLARTVLDCFALLDVIAVREGATSGRSYSDGVREAALAGIAGARIGVPREHFHEGIEPLVSAVVARALDTLAGLGARLEEVSLPHAINSQAIATPLMGAEAASWHKRWLETRADEYGADVRARLRQGALTTAADYLKAQKARTQIRREFLDAFRSVDAIVSPTVPIVAPLRGHTFEPVGELAAAPRSVINRLTVPANLTGFPALSVPCGYADGLPVGLQIMGPPHGESILGAIALTYERATEWHSQRSAMVA